MRILVEISKQKKERRESETEEKRVSRRVGLGFDVCCRRRGKRGRDAGREGSSRSGD